MTTTEKPRRRGKWTEEEKRAAREKRNHARLRDLNAQWRGGMLDAKEIDQAVEVTHRYVQMVSNDDCGDGSTDSLGGEVFGFTCDGGLLTRYQHAMWVVRRLCSVAVINARQRQKAEHLIDTEFIGELSRLKLDAWAQAFATGDYSIICDRYCVA